MRKEEVAAALIAKKIKVTVVRDGQTIKFAASTFSSKKSANSPSLDELRSVLSDYLKIPGSSIQNKVHIYQCLGRPEFYNESKGFFFGDPNIVKYYRNCKLFFSGSSDRDFFTTASLQDPCSLRRCYSNSLPIGRSFCTLFCSKNAQTTKLFQTGRD